MKPIRYNVLLQRLLSFFAILLSAIILLYLLHYSEPRKPSVESIINHAFISKSLIHADNIIGIARYSDVDALLFTYENNMSLDDFSASLIANLKGQNWSLFNSDTQNTWVFQNQKFKHSELRVRKHPLIVVVGYWRSTSDQSKFAKRYLWEEMDRISDLQDN